MRACFTSAMISPRIAKPSNALDLLGGAVEDHVRALRSILVLRAKASLPKATVSIGCF